jgi:hypothetical protein
MGGFPCGEEEIRQAELEAWPRRGDHHDPQGKPNFPRAFHKGRGGAGKSKIYLSCEYFLKKRPGLRRAKGTSTAGTSAADFNVDYDKQGTHSYGVFRHEMMHALDQAVALPKQSNLLRYFKSGGNLDRWFKAVPKSRRVRGLARRQKKEIALLFPVTASWKKNKGHSERLKEIYTNIVGLRARMNRPYQAEDITRLRSASTARRVELVNLPSKISYHAYSDLYKALKNYVNKELTDQQIADLLNQVAAADKIEKPSYMKQTSLAENKLIISLKK